LILYLGTHQPNKQLFIMSSTGFTPTQTWPLSRRNRLELIQYEKDITKLKETCGGLDNMEECFGYINKLIHKSEECEEWTILSMELAVTLEKLKEENKLLLVRLHKMEAMGF
jgi:hypothetical protein